MRRHERTLSKGSLVFFIPYEAIKKLRTQASGSLARTRFFFCRFEIVWHMCSFFEIPPFTVIFVVSILVSAASSWRSWCARKATESSIERPKSALLAFGPMLINAPLTSYVPITIFSTIETTFLCPNCSLLKYTLWYQNYEWQRFLNAYTELTGRKLLGQTKRHVRWFLSQFPMILR